jgi:YesN/AraC family two-component response regulator
MAHILLIDDEELVRLTLREMLRSAGHSVAEAGDGRAALELFDATPPDLVITDILMPEQEGLQTIAHMRERRPHIKIIAMSGGGGPRSHDLFRYATMLGARRALSKPFKKKDLLDAIEEVLAESDETPKSIPPAA